MDERRRTSLIGGAAAAAGLATAAAAARLRGAALGLPLDDAWIHAAFARNLALDRTWGLFAGEPSGGESSLLWPAVLALGELGGAALAPVLALVLGATSFLILPGLVGALASTPVRGRWIAGAVGLCGPLVFLALSGMETMPALTAGTGALVLLRRGHVGRAATAAGIAVLLRPDSVLLVAVLALGVAAGRRDDPPLRGAALLRAWGRLWPAITLVLLAVILLSLVERHFPPATLGGRRWLVGLPADLAPSGAPGGLLALGRAWAAALAAEPGAGRALEQVAWARAWRTAWLLAAVGSVGWGALGILRRTGRQEVRALHLFGAWTLAVLVFYAVVLPDRGHAGRYQPQVYVGGIVLAVEGLAGLITGSRRLRLPALVAALLLGGGLAANLIETAGYWATAVDHVNRLHATAARELAAEAGPGAVVAVFDVGAVAYLRPCPLVDASGLTGPGSLQALQEREVAELLRKRQVTHALLPWWGEPEGPGSLRDRLGLLAPREVRLSLAATWSYAGNGWWRQFRFTGNAFRHLRLYAVEVPDAPRDP